MRAYEMDIKKRSDTDTDLFFAASKIEAQLHANSLHPDRE